MGPMDHDGCSREQELTKAVRTGEWGAGLWEHVQGCDACEETMLVAGMLTEDDAHTTMSVPAAGLVWWKAELRLRRERTAMALRPVVIAERVTSAAVVAALAAGGVWLAASSQSLTLVLAGGIVVLALSAASALFVAHSRK